MKISYYDVYRNLATLLGAGLDIKKALRSSVVKEKGALHDAIIAVANAIDGGASLTRALARQPDVFPPYDRSIIEAGETSGRLSEAFKALAEWYRVKTRLWHIFRNELVAPVLLIHSGAIILPVPKLFTAAGWSGYALAAFSTLMIFYVPAAAIILFYRWSGKQGGFSAFIDTALYRVPILGKAFQDICLGRYCFGFWMLFSSGVPMQKCAEMAADLSGNAVVAAMVAGGGESVRKGQPVSNGFSPETPRDFVALWTVGEQSGRLEETVQRLYRNHTEQGELVLRKFFRLLAGVIGFSVFLVIMDIMFGEISILTGGV